ncbi:unnamed protein product [Sphagnum jensenii]|uniref:Uncharacterized protein n=1 Tax=Sphagnum jensenii TaxID=128206 RepID=A0ABP1B8C3_9BRYO
MGGGDHWRQLSRDPPSLLGGFAYTTLPGSWHLTKSLRVAKAAGVWLVFFLSLVIVPLGGEEFGAERASQGPCADESEDLLAMIELPLLVGEGVQALSLPLGFNLLPFSLLIPCRTPHPAFRILSATRKNSLSLEI